MHACTWASDQVVVIESGRLLWLESFLVVAESRCRVGGVQLERPQPVWHERARTNELDADERRRIIGREDDFGSVCGT
jgi:hypothetical protein